MDDHPSSAPDFANLGATWNEISEAMDSLPAPTFPRMPARASGWTAHWPNNDWQHFLSIASEVARVVYYEVSVFTQQSLEHETAGLEDLEGNLNDVALDAVAAAPCPSG